MEEAKLKGDTSEDEVGARRSADSRNLLAKRVARKTLLGEDSAVVVE